MNTKKEKNLKKKLERKKLKREKHLANFHKLKQQDYYNKKQDLVEIKNYYKNIEKKINYESLSNLIHSTFKKAKRRENIFSIIDRRENYTLKCIYTNKILENEKGELLEEKIDEEHIMPQSFQSGSKSHCGRDMHQIFACTKSANQNRGNKNLGDLGDFVKNGICGKIYKFNNIKSFVPYFNEGVIARAILYILVCYKGAVHESKFPKVYLKYIIECCLRNKVCLWEKHRNAELFKLQGNRNPFIDFPYLVNEINFEKGFK